MFKSLGEHLSSTLDKLKRTGRLTEKNINDALKNVRKALLEADVALSVVKDFIADIRKKAVGQEITRKIKPGDAFVKLVQDELTHVLGDEQAPLNLNAQKPIIFLMAGLQGSGKTTTTAKLSLWLKETKQYKVMVTSTDVYRPAAIDQLRTLAEAHDIDYFPSTPQDKPTDIAKAAIEKAKSTFMDVLIIDTAGRLHIDDAMMAEIKALNDIANPTETLLVLDSMAGQDAANVGKTFHEALPLTGVILTKTDGDARGGAALSMRMITGKPIKFIGVGEKIQALEPFHPDRIASRILGMGDIVSLVEEAERVVDKAEAKKIAKKIQAGERFNFNDFLSQLGQMKKMGGMQSLLGKLPGMGQIPDAARGMLDDKHFSQMEAIIQSMTPKERAFPNLLNGSRKRRIAAGSGTEIQDVNKLLKQFTQMQKMMKRFKGGKLSKQLSRMQHQLPPELRGKFSPDDL